jgi:peptidoglycan/LPS O-acetylase OafA/YrhL
VAVALFYKKGIFKKLNNYIFTLGGIFVITFSVFLLSKLSTEQHLGDHHALGILINNLLMPIAGIAVLFWGLLTEQNIITKLLSTSTMVLFGKSSYVFYLIHIGFLTTFFVQNISGHPIVVFIFLNTMAVLLYKLVESPLHIWLNKKLLKKD